MDRQHQSLTEKFLATSRAVEESTPPGLRPVSLPLAHNFKVCYLTAREGGLNLRPFGIQVRGSVDRLIVINLRETAIV